MVNAESDLSPELRATLSSDASERLYVYSRATGGWFVNVSPLNFFPGAPVPFDFTQLAITRSAVYWQGWEKETETRKGLFGREKREQVVRMCGCSIGISKIERVTISRDGFDPDFATWSREQHLALTVVRKSGASQVFYNWANNSPEVMRDLAAIFSQLGVAIEDHAGVLSVQG